ncbi:hypothetical protein EV363DRAFT_1309254 [Boletus edulis]|nr:hypothetical protein EV363DRAFT_1309254 [Boletus edulis]
MTTRVQCIRSRARAQMQGDVGPPLFAISLMSGLQFDLLDILIRQRLCDIGLHNGATLDEKVYKTVLIAKWVSDFTQQCLSSLKNAGLAASDASQHGDPPMLHANFNLQTPIPLLREWAKATLFVVPSFTTYVALCERLETIDRITDAVECFYDMTNELGGDIYMSEPMTEWVCGEFMFTCLTAVTRAATLSPFTQRRLSAHGNASSNTNRDANMSTIHTTLPPLLREWAKAKLTRGSWKDALVSAVGFTVSRVEIYRVVIGK